MSLEFRNIFYAYQKAPILNDVNLVAKAGEITCLLGPSGCGKTTLLRLAAGILQVQRGEIRLEDNILADRTKSPPPEERSVGLVFQEGALFPHLSVAQNIAFGITEKSARSSMVCDLLDQIGLAGFGGRYPHTLSGGQQQRVALARALAPGPAVMLLDEPYANIDMVRRRELREETRHLLKERECTTVLVTHDPEEAVEIGDQIAVMEAGSVVQAGSAESLYDAPRTINVGVLIGGGHVVFAEPSANGIKTPFGVWPLSSLVGTATGRGRVQLLVRPEAAELEPVEDSPCKVADIRRTGVAQRITVSTEGGETLVLTLPRGRNFNVGQPVSVIPREKAIHAYPA